MSDPTIQQEVVFADRFLRIGNITINSEQYEGLITSLWKTESVTRQIYFLRLSYNERLKFINDHTNST